ncbi:uncharacterized protein LOC129339027 isoform X2 [Eublepharis macularius]|uniref:Uncharacterized protein LOC129339027 isoform X2 n=1 Tax=Eublepharis macularius TaxID=481883 RepID=A0AA97LBI1_EUBMA|nr:uncharacterized protein LOC129339027 isoform X2 [Eublepharis macularius]
MSLKGGLFACDEPMYWRLALNAYWEVLEAKGKKKKDLVVLDKWYQEELPAAIAERKTRYLTREDLVKLMDWKLSRGKFRPRLQQLVATNSTESVESCTEKAFRLLPDVAAAITELSKLKAVGPATASAILAAGAPEAVAFMADEAMESIPGLAPVQYTLKHYMLYLGKIQSCVEKLNKDAEKTWTPQHVEKCLWAWAVAEKLQLPLLQMLGTEKEKGVCGKEADGEPRQKRKRK